MIDRIMSTALRIRRLDVTSRGCCKLDATLPSRRIPTANSTGRNIMDVIYGADGTPRAFRLGNHIYDLDGLPVGKVFAEKAYRLDGSYVGALVNSMVVDKPYVSTRSMAATTPPPSMQVRSAEPRRPIGQTYPDCFDRFEAQMPVETC